MKQFSSIRIDDDVNEGKSYFFEEVKIMGSLLNEVNSGHQNLFVLDEVFKGTNTVERVAAAKAILSYLNSANNLVMISTHDIELASMLTAEYDLYHFTETIEEDKLHFDHTIKSGPVKTRNAIRILELLKYPPEIIAEAKQISERSQVGSRELGTWN
jgi:DNA mismatch repair ATPase MutS